MTEDELKELLDDLDRAAGSVAGAHEWGTSHVSYDKEVKDTKAVILAAFRELQAERDMWLHAMRSYNPLAPKGECHWCGGSPYHLPNCLYQRALEAKP